MKYEDVQFSSTDGIPLRGWWIPATGSMRTVIFLHGFSGSMDPDLKYVPLFHSRGFNILMFDFRAHGRSGGTFTTVGVLEVRDIQGAVTFARARGSVYIGLLGFSMGGRAALLYAASGAPVDAVLADCAPLRLITAISQQLVRKRIPAIVAIILANMTVVGASIRSGVNLFHNDVIHKVDRIREIPLLLMFGEKDPYIPAKEIRHLQSKCSRNVQLWVAPQAGHRAIEQFWQEEYFSRVTGFFDHGVD